MMRKSILLFFLISLFLSACRTGDQQLSQPPAESEGHRFSFTRGGAPIEVIVKLSGTDIDLTETLTVTIETRYEEGVLVTPPFLSQSVYDPLVLVENPVETTDWSASLGRMINRWTYRFEPFESGEFDLKPFSINFRLEKEKTQDLSQWPVYQIQTEPIQYRVRSVEVSELDDIREIKGFILPPFNFVPSAIVLVLFMGILAGPLLYGKYFRNNTTRETQQALAVDHFQETIRRLDELEGKKLLDDSQVERFHNELSIILRDYLEFYFGMKAREQTTEEFITEIFETQQFTEDQREILRRFLHLADLVKFASFQPDSQVSGEALQKVRQFVHHTGTRHED